MSVSILSVGAEVFQFIQGIESKYRIGGNGIMSPAFAAACFGELSIPQAASDGSVRADAKMAVSRLRTIRCATRFLCFSARAEPMGVRLEVSDDGLHGEINAPFEVHWVHAGRDRFRAFF